MTCSTYSICFLIISSKKELNSYTPERIFLRGTSLLLSVKLHSDPVESSGATFPLKKKTTKKTNIMTSSGRKQKAASCRPPVWFLCKTRSCPHINQITMASVENLREIVNERLTAAAEEIFRVFKKTVIEYEQEIHRQRRLLDIVCKPEIKFNSMGK